MATKGQVLTQTSLMSNLRRSHKEEQKYACEKERVRKRGREREGERVE